MKCLCVFAFNRAVICGSSSTREANKQYEYAARVSCEMMAYKLLVRLYRSERSRNSAVYCDQL